MKIGILNFWTSNNFGAVLLTYSLEKAIYKIFPNFEVEGIKYTKEAHRFPWSFSVLRKLGPVYYIKNLGKRLLHYFPAQKKFDEFRKYINASNASYNERTIKEISTIYDKIIIGSDVCWGTSNMYFDETYWLPFIADKNKKLAYAACIPEVAINSKRRDFVIKMLNDFGCITTRNKHTKDLIENCTTMKVNCVLDPVFLLTKEGWSDVIEEPRGNYGKFIFVYQAADDMEFVKYVKHFAKIKSLNIIYNPFPLWKQIKCIRKPYISIGNWLWYIKNAEYVIGDSFHATVLSIIFNKQFYSYIGKATNSGSRIASLLDQFSLQNRLISDWRMKVVDEPIDWERINKQVEVERKASFVHLKAMIEL
ncbi:hypothetical protein AGMMS50293_27030 [Spirochaetia bacterium]|nr:hypothetical protein AGMMS50293_27030 [Spirochaetia bacterium]